MGAAAPAAPTIYIGFWSAKCLRIWRCVTLVSILPLSSLIKTFVQALLVRTSSSNSQRPILCSGIWGHPVRPRALLVVSVRLQPLSCLRFDLTGYLQALLPTQIQATTTPRILCLVVRNLQLVSAHSVEVAIPRHLEVEARLDPLPIMQPRHQRLVQGCLVSPTRIPPQVVHLVVVDYSEASPQPQVSDRQVSLLLVQLCNSPLTHFIIS